MNCYKCDAETEQEEKIDREYEAICDDCLGEMNQCDDCEEYFTDNLTTVTGENGRSRCVCDECRSENYTCCVDCGDYIHRDIAVRLEGGQYLCGSCYDQNYFTCESCGNVYPNDDYGEDDRCSSCSENNNDSGSSYIHDYSYRPSPIFHGPRKECHYGIELEVEAGSGKDKCTDAEYISEKWSNGEEKFYLKEDGSLSNGFEIVTHPHTLDKYTESGVAEAVNYLAKERYRSHNTSTCGLHVHVERRGFNGETHLIKFALVFYQLKGQITILARRDFNNYAANQEKARKKKDIHKSDNRYEALNYSNWNTVEVRIFRGTLKIDTVYASIALCDALRQYAGILNCCQAAKATWKDFCAYVRDNQKRPLYNYLVDYCTSKNIWEGVN